MSFQAVNSSSLAVAVPPPLPIHHSQPSASAIPAMTTSTPSHHSAANSPSLDDPSLKTPTRDSFMGIAGQKPLPSLPTSDTNKRDSAMESFIPKQEDNVKAEEQNEDIEMEDAKSSADGSDDVDGADGGDGKSKKKKGQRFYCTGFAPCNLSFTRSEHLARHIRKHTGERPFQCHCNRKFSRLDNLRQHAQTVHVNEDIPGDSLAASGTRFQRQIRTERARPQNRSRSSTFTSGVAPPHMSHMHRGHSRNVSTSSINSMSSVSTMGGDDYRRGPHGFETPRTNRLSLDTYGSTSSPIASHMQPYHVVGGTSPSGYSTPASQAFSQGNCSPGFSSAGLHSPVNSSRAMPWSTSNRARRPLSYGGTGPFHSQSPDLGSSAHMSPAPFNASIQRHGQYAASPGPSALDSPRDSPGTPIESDPRRHTWGPQINTQLRRPRPEPSVLTTNHISDLPRPVFPSMEQSSSVTRLPGIHTFDQPPPPSALLGARPPSPMHIDQPPTSHPVEPTQKTPVAQHPNRGSWTSGIQRDLNRLDIASESNSRPTSWNPNNQPATVPESPVLPSPIRGHSRHASESSITSAPQATPSTPTARKNKRMGWYIQPPSHQQVPNTERPSPDSSDGAPTPITTSAGFQPAIVQGNGHIEPQGLAIHVEEPPKAGFGQFAMRQSLPPRPQESYGNPFGLQKLHENAPARHFHQAPSHKRHSSHHMYQSADHAYQPQQTNPPPPFAGSQMQTEPRTYERLDSNSQPAPQHTQQPSHHARHARHARHHSYHSHLPHPVSQPHQHQPGKHAHQSFQQVQQLHKQAFQSQEHREQPEPYNHPGAATNDTRRLDALVAVATTEQQRS